MQGYVVDVSVMKVAKGEALEAAVRMVEKVAARVETAVAQKEGTMAVV